MFASKNTSAYIPLNFQMFAMSKYFATLLATVNAHKVASLRANARLFVDLCYLLSH